jgi:hypothetical protein
MRSAIVMLLVVGAVSAADKPKPPRDLADVIEREYRQVVAIKVAINEAVAGGDRKLHLKTIDEVKEERKAWNDMPVKGRGQVSEVYDTRASLVVVLTMKRNAVPGQSNGGFTPICSVYLQLSDPQDEVAKGLRRGSIVEFSGKLGYVPSDNTVRQSPTFTVRHCTLKSVNGKTAKAKAAKPKQEDIDPRDIATVIHREYEQQAKIKEASEGGNRLMLQKVMQEVVQERRGWHAIPVTGQAKVWEVQEDNAGLLVTLLVRRKLSRRIVPDVNNDICYIKLRMTDEGEEVARGLLRDQVVEFSGTLGYVVNVRTIEQSKEFSVANCKLKLVTR